MSGGSTHHVRPKLRPDAGALARRRSSKPAVFESRYFSNDPIGCTSYASDTRPKTHADCKAGAKRARGNARYSGKFRGRETRFARIASNPAALGGTAVARLTCGTS